EGETQVHARRVALQRRVEEPLHAGEGDDLLEPALDLPPLHAEDGAVEVDVLAPRELGVEARADLEQGAHAPAGARQARGGLGDARQDPQQRALAGAVEADHAEHLAPVDVQVDVAQGPHLAPRVAAPAPDEPGERLAQGQVRARAEAVTLAHAPYLDRRARHQITSANERSTRWK